VAKRFGRYRVSACNDWFGVGGNGFIAEDNNNENGTPFTVAFSIKFAKKKDVIPEHLCIDSRCPARKVTGLKKIKAMIFSS